MASVSSLDKDLARLRRSKYTPEASAAVSTWLSSTLGETLPAGDLMDILKDGTLLCRLANHLAITTGGKQLKPKKSAMPFVQMENISQFLTAISSPPVSLPPHDRFLTVDLFEKKDPAQVLQCLGAFSRVANSLNPTTFPDTVGGLKGGATPVGTGAAGKPPAPTVPGKKVTVSAWAKPGQEGATAPAWNVAQYGYMGGASQGNQGIMFGGRRQITATPPLTAGPGSGGTAGVATGAGMPKLETTTTTAQERETLKKQNEAERLALRRRDEEEKSALLKKQGEERTLKEEMRLREEEKIRKAAAAKVEEEKLRKAAAFIQLDEEKVRKAAAATQLEEEKVRKAAAIKLEEEKSRQAAARRNSCNKRRPYDNKKKASSSGADKKTKTTPNAHDKRTKNAGGRKNASRMSGNTKPRSKSRSVGGTKRKSSAGNGKPRKTCSEKSSANANSSATANSPV
ncbi:hypothetical protein BZA05DRAFT_427621 [Tricharina praecox]|uniref:uncharacterized protein n=1 Tax=Tricharina praecox TaxID=43433 RepID=UPI002220F4DC|nr:uncharacterized protein BZA05DRAFT_427621 [Tricharina praecox]KAI5842249.1 hypothetical protein BZA05DRAFT_427621 [Tricharina praecox]